MTEEQALEARAKFVNAWNDTMLKIWREQITLLDVIDTGRLLQSPISFPVKADGRFFEISLSQAFLEYGLWQDYGTGKEFPRNNPGDNGIGRVRKKKKWFSPKYYASVMKLRDFLAESVGEEFVGLLSNALDDRIRRQQMMNKANDNHRRYSDMM